MSGRARDPQAPYFVYRLLDADGSLLYVGCTSRLRQRRASLRRKPWWAEVMSWRIVGPFADRARAFAYEQCVHDTEQPRYGLSDRAVPAIGAARRKAQAALVHERGERFCSVASCPRCLSLRRWGWDLYRAADAAGDVARAQRIRDQIFAWFIPDEMRTVAEVAA